jgi:regulatory protein
MKILSTKRSGRNRVEISFENEEKVTLAYEIYLRFGLKINGEISEAQLSSIVFEDQKYQVKQAALNLIARRHHSKNELLKKLFKKKFDKELISIILNDLEMSGYINDSSFARIFADEKLKSRSWGKIKIKGELIKRGIASDIISEVIDEKFSVGLEIELGLELARKKMKKLIARKSDSKKIQSSVFNFLISRGYDYEACKEIYNKLLEEESLSGI